MPRGWQFTRLARLLKRGSASIQAVIRKACCYVDGLCAQFLCAIAGARRRHLPCPSPAVHDRSLPVMADVGGYAKPKLTLPMPLMLLTNFWIAGKAGGKNTINRDRVMKLVRSIKHCMQSTKRNDINLN